MREYEQVGVVDVEIAAAMPDDTETVAVEAPDVVGPDQRLLARPKGGNDE